MRSFYYFVLLLFLFSGCAKKLTRLEKLQKKRDRKEELHKRECRLKNQVSKRYRQYDRRILRRDIPKGAFLYRVRDQGTESLTSTLYIDGHWKFVLLKWPENASEAFLWLKGEIILDSFFYMYGEMVGFGWGKKPPKKYLKYLNYEKNRYLVKTEENGEPASLIYFKNGYFLSIYDSFIIDQDYLYSLYDSKKKLLFKAHRCFVFNLKYWEIVKPFRKRFRITDILWMDAKIMDRDLSKKDFYKVKGYQSFLKMKKKFY